MNNHLIIGNTYTALDVQGNNQGVHHRLQINRTGSASVCHSDSSEGNWTADIIALKSDLTKMITGYVKVHGISNYGRITIKVGSNDYRYGTIFLVVSSHITRIKWAGTSVTSVKLSTEDVTAVTSSDGLTLTITMHSNYEHGFFIVGGGCCSGNGPTITLSNF